MERPLNPPANPRKGVATALIVAALVALATVVVVATDTEEAEAAPLRRFTSCAELETWGAVANEVAAGGAATFETVGGEVAEDSAAVGAPSTTAAAPEAAGADGVANRATLSAEEADALDETNVVVEGVDELDLIDRLAEDRLLVASQETLAIVDLGAPEVLDRLPIAWGTQITYDGESGRAWLVGSTDDGAGVEVRRVDVGDGSLAEAGTWSTPGQLVDARRVGDRLHLVASDGFWGPEPIPFEGGPVPCDDVLHPEGPSDPSATLLVTLPVTGELEPTAATEVVGSGRLVHVTTDAAYLATPTWSSSTPRTGIHRFDLADLTHTGSGSVEGSLLNDFSMSEHGGHLRVATTVDGGCCWGGPVASGRGVTVDDGETVFSIVDGAVAEEPGVDPDLPPPSSSIPTETTVPETTVPETTTTEVVPETTTTTEAPATTTTVVPETIPEPEPRPDPAEGLNRIVVLDTDGDLDVVGETERFGHPGETLHGIRFVGDVAYAVTFLQTDPFYVVDLADPAAPTVVGEVELPGFNAYLHPVGDDAVVGFGPGVDGRTTAELFDVSDPTSPRVAGSIVVGDDSPVVYDHHAFTDLGDGRFAVPASDWSGADIACPPDALCEAGSPASDIVTLEVDGDELREVERRTVTLDGYQQAARALPAGDGWAVLGETQVVVLDGSGDEVGRVSLT